MSRNRLRGDRPVAVAPDQEPVSGRARRLTAGLTVRERDVLQWVSAGKTDRDIADILGLSPRTVQKHLQHIYTKLGVETRTAAAMRTVGR